MEHVTKEELSQLTDVELREKAKKLKSSSIWSALIIGFMIGVVVYSVAANTLGLLTLIPLFFIYKIVKGSKNNDALKEVLQERGIK